MSIATGNTISVTPAAPGWDIILTASTGGRAECPLIGWATVATGTQEDGTTTTDVEPAFWWNNAVWTQTTLTAQHPEMSLALTQQ